MLILLSFICVKCQRSDAFVWVFEVFEMKDMLFFYLLFNFVYKTNFASYFGFFEDIKRREAEIFSKL
jgi:hypothetical protein